MWLRRGRVPEGATQLEGWGFDGRRGASACLFWKRDEGLREGFTEGFTREKGRFYALRSAPIATRAELARGVEPMGGGGSFDDLCGAPAMKFCTVKFRI